MACRSRHPSGWPAGQSLTHHVSRCNNIKCLKNNSNCTA
jgi:hypothetical protein